jgi:uncharacterized membrane protein YfcA
MSCSLTKWFQKQFLIKIWVLLTALIVVAYVAFGDRVYLTLVSFFAASIANATAVGGGFLFMPLFIYVYKLAPVVALKLSIATQAFGMTSGALSWGRRFIDMQAFAVASIASIVGVWFASFVWVVPSSYIKPLFAVISLGVFIALVLEMRYKESKVEGGFSFSHDKATWFFIISAFAGGLITGWTAIGVGEVVALYLLFVYRLKVDVAIATGVAVLAVSSLAGFLFHIILGGIPWYLLAFTVPGVILGGRYGAKLAINVESKVKASQAEDTVAASPLKLFFAGVILVDCVVILLSEMVTQSM